MHTLINTDFDTEGLTQDQVYFYHWILEREKCRVGRESGWPKPWSLDPILQNYRFCNVRREDDVVTKWIHENWLHKYDGAVPNYRMVAAMCAARLFNRVTTLERIGFPLLEIYSWVESAREQLKLMRESEPIWTGAYLVSTNGHAMDKVDYILDKVLKPIIVHQIMPYRGETLQSFHKRLMAFDGMGSFMAGQVIADLKFSSLFDPQNTADWWTWAPIGPGSKRGLNRYFGRPLEKSISDKNVLEELNLVQCSVAKRLGLALAVHNIQNCFCEYDKWMRVFKGEGKPRSKYNGLK